MTKHYAKGLDGEVVGDRTMVIAERIAQSASSILGYGPPKEKAVETCEVARQRFEDRAGSG